MVILHIANIDTDILGGVQVAVPEMVRNQGQYAEVAFINTNNKHIDQINQLPYSREFNLKNYPFPFCKPDIVVFHEIYRFEYIAIYKALKKRGIPYIIIPHGSFARKAQAHKFLKKKIANLLFFGDYIRSAEAVQYLSNREKMTSSFSVNSFICENGIAIPQKYKESFFENGIKFLYIGRLEIDIKGLDLLIYAIAQNRIVLEEYNCSLTICGPNYNNVHSVLKDMVISLGVDHLVEIKKEVLCATKEKELLSADYFIQTSRTEGMPLGILEALSYGLPCIVTEGTGFGRSVTEKKAGFGCETSVEGIKSAIIAAINNKNEIEKFSENARIFAKERFDCRMIAQKAITEYKYISEKTDHREV